MAATKRLAKERVSLERDPIPYITFVEDNGDDDGNQNILEWKIILELSPSHDSLGESATIGKARDSPYCKPPTEAPIKEKSKGILAGVTRASKSSSKSSNDASAGNAHRPAGPAYFAFKFVFPVNYPFKPPIITVLTNSYHPNINSKNGEICDSILTGEGWGPTLNVKMVCARLRKLLCDPDPDHPLESEIAQTLVDKPEDYAKMAYKHAGEHCSHAKATQAAARGTK